MESRKQGLDRGAFTARRRQETASLTRQQREATLRSKRRRVEAAAEATTRSVDAATAGLAQALLHSGGPALLGAVRELRRSVSAQQAALNADALAGATVPLLVRVLRMQRQAPAVFEAGWALTNLAADEHDVAAAALPAAPLLAAHLAGACGHRVAEQCAWALGNLAGDCAAFCATLAANGAVLPLARLLMRGAEAGRPAAACAARAAAWALCNLLWGLPGQAGHLLDVPGFRDALPAILSSADAQLREEAAWLLAFICAGPEAHMHAMVRHGAAAAAVDALTNTAAGQEGAATPLLRCLGNMAASRAAADVLRRRPECVAAVQRCVERPGLRDEAAWVLDNIAAALA